MIWPDRQVRAATAQGRTALAITPLSLALIAGLGGPRGLQRRHGPRMTHGWLDPDGRATPWRAPSAAPRRGRDRSQRLRGRGGAGSPGGTSGTVPGGDRGGRWETGVGVASRAGACR